MPVCQACPHLPSTTWCKLSTLVVMKQLLPGLPLAVWGRACAAAKALCPWINNTNNWLGSRWGAWLWSIL